ncbi:hypothetical protein TcYC6_0066860 [Trypanosoma cruzi]|nr:hypothetical protein TcYC6_0066980 [Trypanosoma cruzi]KAF8299372.1 hypothetical protein TcYC6_0066900 [Trypanosoma cruzi]KAF8299516.1 hypothetical protein TcYC6_0067020 [Trypanosoma cruzi]KAF8299581.1 hypothetical protein TcYC6_0066860 [Trypanosoma cruzi]
MRSGGVCLCLTALQLFALERRKTTTSYKYFEDTASIRAAFFRLTDAERELLEQSAMALRHDVALTSVCGEEGCLEVATDDIAVQIDDPSGCAVDAAGDPTEESGAREIYL